MVKSKKNSGKQSEFLFAFIYRTFSYGCRSVRSKECKTQKLRFIDQVLHVKNTQTNTHTHTHMYTLLHIMDFLTV